MKVISLLQPWATLVVIGAKKIETRSWNTKYRGDLLIHASAGTKMAKRLCPTNMFCNSDFGLAGYWADLPYGAIIGKVKLEHTVKSEVCFVGNEFEIKNYRVSPTEKLKWNITEQEKTLGDFSPKRYGWLLAEPVRFENPIPVKGSLMLWDFPMCRVCGCWEQDACIHPTKGNCSWAEEDLCSHCKTAPGQSKRYTQIMKEVSDQIHHS